MTQPIEFRDVYRHFHRHEVLRGLSFQVRPGEIYALLGRNGEGKTTALRILLGFLEPMAGETSILGVEGRSLSPADRERIGYVSEGHRLYPTMTLRQALTFESGTRKRFDRAYAEKCLARLGLKVGQFIQTLSRGQRAQVALVFAVASEPEVLVFDDPALGLDVVMRREFLDVMIDLLAERGVSVLFSSHVLTDVERIADRVGILKDGRLIVDSTIVDLRQRVERRFWGGGNGTVPPPPECDGLLRARRTRDGYQLTLLDFDDRTETSLRSGGTKLSAPVVPSLEDLFFDLTAGDAPAFVSFSKEDR